MSENATRSPQHLRLQGGEPALGPRPEGRPARRVGWGSRNKHRVGWEAGPPPGALACHRAGQGPDPLGATLPLAAGGIRARHLTYAISSAVILACTVGTLMAQPAPPPAQQPQQKLTIGFVEIDGDPRYEPIKGFERLILKAPEHPFAGAQVGIDEAQALTRVLKTDFVLERITVKSTDEAVPAVQQAMEGRNIHFFLIDVPAEAYKPLAAAVRGRDALLFNVSTPDDSLRRELCAPEFVHAMPSRAMLMDA